MKIIYFLLKSNHMSSIETYVCCCAPDVEIFVRRNTNQKFLIVAFLPCNNALYFSWYEVSMFVRLWCQISRTRANIY